MAPALPHWNMVGAPSGLSISTVRVSLYWPEAAVTTFTGTPVSSVYCLARSCQAWSDSGLKFR